MASVRVLGHALHRRCSVISSLPGTHNSCYFNLRPYASQNASYSTKKSMVNVDSSEAQNKVQVGFAEVVKENTKTAGYLGITIIGIGITALMGYAIVKELFSSKSINGVYSKALNRCMSDPKVLDMLGEPIKAYGEESRRGRRTHKSHTYFKRNGVTHMRMKFYIQGIRRRGTVTLEVKENDRGDYEYIYLYVIIDDIMKTAIKLEDNRQPEITYSDMPETNFI